MLKSAIYKQFECNSMFIDAKNHSWMKNTMPRQRNKKVSSINENINWLFFSYARLSNEKCKFCVFFSSLKENVCLNNGSMISLADSRLHRIMQMNDWFSSSWLTSLISFFFSRKININIVQRFLLKLN